MDALYFVATTTFTTGNIGDIVPEVHYIGCTIKLGFGAKKTFLNNRGNGMSGIGGLGRIFETAHTAWCSTTKKFKKKFK
jgi:hypothetical protein